MAPFRLVLAVCVALLTLAAVRAAEPNSLSRAVNFLKKEVPAWAPENKCFSCHNNGDGVRALIHARNHGLLRDAADFGALDQSFDFLRHSERWDANGPDGPFKDKKLARIQFAAALAEMGRAGRMISDGLILARAAKLVAEMQSADGSWEIETSRQPGSPATYGQALGSYMALQAVMALENAAANKARKWFVNFQPRGPLDAAATLMAIAPLTDEPASAQRKRALALIEKGQAESGGWGPFVNSPPEAFDTAVVLIALARHPDRKWTKPLIERGRKYLVGLQLEDGSWPATTRPPGADSYAQRISTTSWALMALLETR